VSYSSTKAHISTQCDVAQDFLSRVFSSL